MISQRSYKDTVLLMVVSQVKARLLFKALLVLLTFESLEERQKKEVFIMVSLSPYACV